MQASDGSLARHAAMAACLTLMCAAGVAAQPQPVVAPAPSAPQFFSRYDFHLSAAALAIDDQRFSWDTHFGGSLDLADYVAGRVSVTIDYQAVLGNEFRAFDPNQGNYILEAAASARVGPTEIVGTFHHVSRHLSDRAKRFPIAWNVLGARLLRRLVTGSATMDLDVDGGVVTERSTVDYSWTGGLNLVVRRPLTPRVAIFAEGSGQLIGVDGSVSGRGTQTGGAVEAGVRLNGRAGAIEIFAGFEKRIDAFPLEFQSQHWGLAGFRLLSR